MSGQLPQQRLPDDLKVLADRRPYESPGIEGNAYKLRGFEVQWRPHLTTHWVLMRSYDNRADAAMYATQTFAVQGGQVRIVQQTVIAAVGLGEGEID